mmetsp:Transcript_19773/g.32052  ORF Transcript_19773/g.32052 Transcript_19773/m.32052 type:complete len:626 (+) Transcript_19773:111-1988(+)
MACDATSRYHQLLQPIRDLSKVWNIAIAEELEKYLDEVSSLSFQTEGDCRQLNFAEAALLIQGSAAVYSRKVEMLYTLVYQALSTCQQYSDKDEAANIQLRKKLHTGLWAPIPETEELLTIDHLIKEGRNITIDESGLRRQEQKQFPNLRLPLFLIPREKNEGAQEFRIGNCSVHSSGAYLLQESDAQLLDEFISSDGLNDNSRTPLVPPPPKEVHDLDERLQKMLRGLQEHVEVSQSPLHFDDTTGALACSGMGATLPDLEHEALIPLGDKQPNEPWELLDEHEQVGQDTPLEVSSCTKRLGAKRLLAKADVFPKRGSFEPLSDADFWRPGHASDGLPELLASGHPVEAVFSAVSRIIRHGNRPPIVKAGFSAAWLEFDDLFEVMLRRERKNNFGKGSGVNIPEIHCGEYSDDDGGTPRRGQLDNEFGDFIEEPIQERKRREVAKIEGLIEEAQTQYETTIRNQLHQIHGNEHIMNEKYPELYENVRRWQQQLKPVLKEFESHPEFNIDGYREKVLNKMAVVEKVQADTEKEDKPIPFARLVYGKPHWEVCRRFLTCLILTNQGSTDIVLESEQDSLNNFSMKLLKEDSAEAERIASGNDDIDEQRSESRVSRAPKRAKLGHRV